MKIEGACPPVISVCPFNVLCQNVSFVRSFLRHLFSQSEICVHKNYTHELMQIGFHVGQYLK